MNETPNTQSAAAPMQQGMRAVQVLRQRLNDVLIGQSKVVDDVQTVFLAAGPAPLSRGDGEILRRRGSCR